MLEELEEALITSGALPLPVSVLGARLSAPWTDFGPRTSLKIVDLIRERVKDGELKTGADIRAGCA